MGEMRVAARALNTDAETRGAAGPARTQWAVAVPARPCRARRARRGKIGPSVLVALGRGSDAVSAEEVLGLIGEPLGLPRSSLCHRSAPRGLG